MKLETDRLYLEILDEKHFPDFLPLEIDPDVMKFIRKESPTIEAARINFDRLLNYNKTYPGFGAFAVVKKNTSEFIGLGVIIHIELKPENEKYEIGYRLAKSAWGKGFATEIARRLIDYGFDDLGLSEIYGTTHPQHVVSQKTLMKAGLERIGDASYYNGCAFFRITGNKK